MLVAEGVLDSEAVLDDDGVGVEVSDAVLVVEGDEVSDAVLVVEGDEVADEEGVGQMGISLG